MLASAEVVPPAGIPAGVEAVERRTGETGYLFLINHGDTDARVPASGHDLLTGTDHEGETVVPAGAVRVLARQGSDTCPAERVAVPRPRV